MTLTEAIRARICGLCAERGLSINKLASRCGITQSTLSNIFRRECAKPTVSTIKKVCDGLEISLGEFFCCEIFDGLEQEIK